MNAVTITKTLILGVPSVFLVTVTAVWLYRKARDRSKVGEADVIASAVHDREFLEWLDGQFDSQGRVRP